MAHPRRYLSWLLFLGWSSAIAWLSLTPAPPRLYSPLFGWDKFQHACAYAVLTLFAGIAFGRTRRAFAGAFLLAILYGGCMELAQGYFTVSRMADWFDELANLAGSGVTALLATRFLARRKDNP